MDDKLIIVISWFILLIFLIIIYYIYKVIKANKNVKRINTFALSSNNDNSLSFLDKVINMANNFIQKFGNLLTKIKALKKYTLYYDESYQINNKPTSYYLALKVLLSLIFSILYIIFITLNKTNINFFIFLIIFILSFIIVDLYLHKIYIKQRKQIENDLFHTISIINNAFKAGKNINQAINEVTEKTTGAMASEYRKIALDLKFGLSLEQAFLRFYERIKINEVKYISATISLFNKTGGNIIQAFSTIEKRILAQKLLKEEYKSRITPSLLLYKILLIIPFILSGILCLINRDYFKIFFYSNIGLIILAIIILLYILFILVIKNILQVNKNE